MVKQGMISKNREPHGRKMLFRKNIYEIIPHIKAKEPPKITLFFIFIKKIQIVIKNAKAVDNNVSLAGENRFIQFFEMIFEIAMA